MKRRKLTSRRNFLVRGAALLGAMGVSPLIRLEFMEKWAKKLGLPHDDVYAETISPSHPVHFVIEIVLRAGYPFSTLFPLGNDKLPERTASLCAGGANIGKRSSPWRPEHITTIDGTRPGTFLHFAGHTNMGIPNNYVGSLPLLALVQDGTIKIACSNSFEPNGDHHAYFATRHVVTNYTADEEFPGTAPCPAIHFANLTPHQTLIKGLELRPDSSIPITANGHAEYDPFIRVSGSTTATAMTLPDGTSSVPLSIMGKNFISLFSPVFTQASNTIFNANEIGLIRDATDKLNLNYINYTPLSDPDFAQANLNLGMDLITANYANSLVPTAAEYSTYGYTPNIPPFRGGVRLTESMIMAMKAFSQGLVSGITITYNSSDWHEAMKGDPNQLGVPVNEPVDFTNPSYNGMGTRYELDGTNISRAIATAYSIAKNLDSPFGGKVADHVAVLMTSEFSRGILNSNCPSYDDHSDGATNSIVIIGPTAANISGGDFNATNPTNSGVVVIDQNTGLPNPLQAKYSTGRAYATLCKAIGIPDEEIHKYTAESTVNALLKP